MSVRARAAAGEPSLAADYVTLLKPRIASFVGLAAFVGGLLVGDARAPAWRVAEAALWVTLAAGAASAFNQVMERDTDRRMERTRERPVPSGRVAPLAALLYATVLAAISIAALGFRFNALAAALTLATLFAYVAVYTPIKRFSTLNTVIGALPGAAPPLLGYAAIAGRVDGWAWALFAVIFVWQFPHFMAIAWLHRHDYARAGLRMLPVEAGGEGVAGRAALTYALVLLPVTLMPGAWGQAGLVFTAGAFVASLVYAGAALRFALRQDRATARFLLFTSLVHLPLVLLLAVFDPASGALAAHGVR